MRMRIIHILRGILRSSTIQYPTWYYYVQRSNLRGKLAQ